MSKNKKSKLTAHQKKQLAAIEEIEAFLNVAEENISTNKAKNKTINVKKRSQSSPYLIDLKKINNNKTKSQSSIEDKAFLYLTNTSNKIKGASSDGLKNFQQRLKKVRTLAKKLPEYKKTLKTSNKVELKAKAVKKIKKGKKIVKAINQASQQIKKVETPASVLIKGLATSHRLSSVWKFYFADALKKPEKHLRGLAIFDLLAFIIFVIMQIGKFIKNILASFLTKLLTILNLIIKKIPLVAIVKSIYSASKKIINLFILGIKKSGRVIFSSSSNALKQSQQIVNEMNDDLTATAKRIKKWSPRDLVPKISWPKLSFLPPLSWQRQLVLFILLTGILTLPFKGFGYLQILYDVQGRVLGVSEKAADNLQQATVAGSQLNFASAAKQFSQAADNFTHAQATLAELSELLTVAQIIPTKKAQLAADSEELLMAAESASKIGELMANALASLEFGQTGLNKKTLTKQLDNFLLYSRQAQIELIRFSDNLAEIDPDNLTAINNTQAQNVSQQLTFVKDNIDYFNQGVEELIIFTETLQRFLGKDLDTRYLLVFQNNAEMRASGGFIGSFALVDFSQGEIKNIEAPGGGSYDLQGGLHKRVASPQPMHLINSLWEFQDANWWPDWPRSAEKLAWFFENGWGSSVDGVISITPTYFEEMLKVIGPIDMTEKYGVVINSHNFYDIVQTESENKDTDTPKEIIGDLIDELLEVLPTKLETGNLIELAKVTEQMLSAKHILFYFNDEQLQNFATAHNWDGRIKDISGDYLAVINTNIAGGKSDRAIRQTISHTAEVIMDGSIINTVKIKREHTAARNIGFAGVRNVNYLRVYVPKGSTLIEAHGFDQPDEIYFDEPATEAETDPYIYLVENTAEVDETSGVKIYDEFKKTVFANWTQVDPGETAVITIRYKLPFKIKAAKESNNNLASYVFYLQKQSGSVNNIFSSQLILPKSMSAVWHSQNINVPHGQGWQIDNNLRTDQGWGIIIKK